MKPKRDGGRRPPGSCRRRGRGGRRPPHGRARPDRLVVPLTCLDRKVRRAHCSVAGEGSLSCLQLPQQGTHGFKMARMFLREGVCMVEEDPLRLLRGSQRSGPASRLPQPRREIVYRRKVGLVGGALVDCDELPVETDRLLRFLDGFCPPVPRPGRDCSGTRPGRVGGLWVGRDQLPAKGRVPPPTRKGTGPPPYLRHARAVGCDRDGE
jgi:hypothetical protein